MSCRFCQFRHLGGGANIFFGWLMLLNILDSNVQSACAMQAPGHSCNVRIYIAFHHSWAAPAMLARCVWILVRAQQLSEHLFFYQFYNGLLIIMLVQVNCKVSSVVGQKNTQDLLHSPRFPQFLAQSSIACSLRCVNRKVPTITENMFIICFIRVGF